MTSASPDLPHGHGIAGVILTLNEVQHIAACIRSLQPFLDHIVVLDSGSSDGTRELARQCGASVLLHPFRDYAHQRQMALDLIQCEWILFVDADERIPRALGQEIREVCTDATLNGAWIPRVNYIVRDHVRWGGFSPDAQLRLLRRTCASYREAAAVHETAAVHGPTCTLENPLIHFNYDSWSQFHAKQLKYARFEARRTSTGDRVPGWTLLKRFLQVFRYRYLQLEGWKDGRLGLQLAVWLAWYYGLLPYALALLQPNRENKA